MNESFAYPSEPTIVGIYILIGHYKITGYAYSSRYFNLNDHNLRQEAYNSRYFVYLLGFRMIPEKLSAYDSRYLIYLTNSLEGRAYYNRCFTIDESCMSLQ